VTDFDSLVMFEAGQSDFVIFRLTLAVASPVLFSVSLCLSVGLVTSCLLSVCVCVAV